MPLPPAHPGHPQHAVDTANAAIRGHLRGIPGGRLVTAGERARYEGLVADYNTAVTRLLALRKTQDEPAAGLVLTA